MKKLIGLVLIIAGIMASMPKYEANAADFNFPRQPLPTTKQEFVGQLYRCFLNRDADAAGLAFWTQNGASVDHLYNAFVNSGEYQERNRANSQFIVDMYDCTLYRSPDTNGYFFWLNDLNSGRKNRAEMLEAFLVSIEFNAYIRPNLNYIMTKQTVQSSFVVNSPVEFVEQSVAATDSVTVEAPAEVTPVYIDEAPVVNYDQAPVEEIVPTYVPVIDQSVVVDQPLVQTAPLVPVVVEQSFDDQEYDYIRPMREYNLF